MYKAEIDLNTNKTIVNGKVVNANEYLNLQGNENIEELKESLNNLITGDVEIEDGKIEITNDYTSNGLFVETQHLNEIDDLGNVESITKIATDIYDIGYYNAIDTKKAYINLSKNKLVNSVERTGFSEALDNEDEGINNKAINKGK
jgi:hypothetical protein